MSDDRVAIARITGDYYIAPNGRAMSRHRIGVVRGGVVVSTPDLSDDEIEAFGLTGKVLPASADANRLHGKAMDGKSADDR